MMNLENFNITFQDLLLLKYVKQQLITRKIFVFPVSDIN